MTGSVTSASSSPLSYLLSDLTDPVEIRSVSGANDAINLLIKTTDYVDSLVAHSSRYLPPTSLQVMSTLWGLLNMEGSTELTKPILEHAVVTQGGSYASANHLWEQLKLDNKSTLSPKEFVNNAYLLKAMPLVFDSVKTAVEDTRLYHIRFSGDTSSTGTLFDFYTGNNGSSGSMLDFFT